MPLTQSRLASSASSNFGHDFSAIPTFASQSGKVADLGRIDSLHQVSHTEVVPRSEAVFTFQTFIPNKYVPGTNGLAYGDDRDFGKPGDSYRTFQQIVVQTDERLSAAAIEGSVVARTGESKTTVPFTSGHASTAPLHMTAERRDSHSVTVLFTGSIKHGAIGGGLFPAIDFTGAIVISSSGAKQAYGFYASHDAFPAYEAFIDDKAIYRWSYPVGSTVADLVGSGTAVQGRRKTGDAPGGIVANRILRFGGGSFGGGGSGGNW